VVMYDWLSNEREAQAGFGFVAEDEVKW
jgi:hypothetical protein